MKYIGFFYRLLLKTIFLLFLQVSFFSEVHSQTEKVLAYSTEMVSPNNSISYYYSLAYGDTLILSFNENQGKSLSQFKVRKNGGEVLLDLQDVDKFKNQRLSIGETGVYEFLFTNNSESRRICKFKIARKAKDTSSENFTTDVIWEKTQDWKTVLVEEEYVISRDTVKREMRGNITNHYGDNGSSPVQSFFSLRIPKNTLRLSYTVDKDKKGFGNLDFYILDTENYELFVAGKDFYFIKKGSLDNLNEYELGKKATQYLCIKNKNSNINLGLLNIQAQMVTENMAIREVEKDLLVTNHIPVMSK